MITPKQKDSILNAVLNEYDGGVETFSLKAIANEYELPDHIVRLYFKQLNEMGLADFSELTGGMAMISFTLDAYEFVGHGGFVAKEELLEANIKKLLLEIESLKPSMPDKVAMITGIASNIAAALSLFAR